MILLLHPESTLSPAISPTPSPPLLTPHHAIWLKSSSDLLVGTLAGIALVASLVPMVGDANVIADVCRGVRLDSVAVSHLSGELDSAATGRASVLVNGPVAHDEGGLTSY